MYRPYEDAPRSYVVSAPWQRLLAVPVALVAGVTAATFPVIPHVLTAAAIAYAALLVWRPHAWLVVLPLLMPVLELAPWSGRVLFDEFDIFTLLSVAGALWHRHFRAHNLAVKSRTAAALLALLCAAWTVSLFRGAIPLGPLDGNALSGYFTHYNSLRIFKGFLWAVLLAPALGQALRENKGDAERLLAYGFTGGLLAVGIVVLWERGILGDVLEGRGIYRTLGDVLNFTTEYRITALFSEMHTGGASIDGYLALVWPFSLLPAFTAQRWIWKAAGILAFLLGLYAMAVTFSRDVYGAFIVSSLVLIGGLLASHPRWLSPRGLVGLIPAVCAIGLLAFYDHHKGGTVAVFSLMMGFTGAAAIAWEAARTRGLILLVLAGALALISFLGVVHGMMTSKWVHNGLVAAAAGGMLSIIGAGAAGGVFGLGLRNVRRSNVLLLVMLVGAAIAAAVTVGGGYRMESRFSTVAEDTKTRLDHWKAVLAAMAPGWTAKLFGMGLGSFPTDFLLYTNNSEHLGTYAFRSTADGQTYLRLGGGQDTELGQRIPLAPNSLYRITARIRGNDPRAMLYMAVCEKNILVQQAYQPNCIYPKFAQHGMSDRWQTVTAVINTGRVGQRPWYDRWPSVLLISNGRLGTVLDVAQISVVDGENRDLVRNGSFQHGGDRWFSYNDFEHLQWHTKNLWLNVYFEQGLLGVFSLLGCLSAGLTSGFNRARCREPYPIVTVSGLCGFIAVGMFGSLFDSPRLIFLFLLALWSMLLNSKRGSLGSATAALTR